MWTLLNNVAGPKYGHSHELEQGIVESVFLEETMEVEIIYEVIKYKVQNVLNQTSHDTFEIQSRLSCI